MEFEKMLTVVSILCWNIWKARCAFLYQQRPVSLSHTITTSLNLVSEFLEASKWPLSSPIQDSSRVVDHCNWTAPPPGFTKVNCDAAWVAPNSAGLGVIIRDHLGSSLGGSAIPATCSSAAIVESEALLSGVDLAISLNLKMVKFESDAKEVIENLKLPICRNWKIYPIIEKIRRRCTFFDCSSWEWVPREANRAAHLAASLANRTVGPLRWANQPPPSLTRVLRNDGLPCPPPLER
ncbi:hypothetical protein ABKV19_006701 [Rosa sericea]